ncbi:MAG TPA: DNA repair protein RecN [Ferruginibacter sp.]|nr:DNA repair protein RecN [Ferruginibacter sp.]HMP21366.1 DNA repair protein RecN [Ferruginibacter sp.]
MLKKLHIKNYAIIDEITVAFSSNFNIITGETGAGKSILVGALSLVLGERADSSVLYDTKKKAVVEAQFDVANNHAVTALLESFELDTEPELLVRREVAAAGKSRAFVNDTPVTLSQLKKLAAVLVDLHQQFDTLELGEFNFQREVLDALADNTDLLKEYSHTYKAYIQASHELATLQQQQQQADATLDYNRFLFEELDAAGFTQHEIEETEAELKLLNNTEHIKQQLDAVCFTLADSEEPVIYHLKTIVNKLRSVSGFHPEIETAANRIQAAMLEIQDAANDTTRLNDSIQYNAERIQWLNDRLSLGYRLFKKHSVQSTAELLEIKNTLEEKLQQVLHAGDAMAAKDKLVQQYKAQCEQLAHRLSERRNKAINPFTKAVNEMLTQVGMPNARLTVQLEQVALNEYGCNEIEFLFDANKSNRFEPLRKVASGGELSRLMLCIKSLVAKKLQLPTLIFDEIDTGISGEAAKQVGIIMKELAAQHQVISITHQPQIAARAHAHFYVYKESKANRITTAIKLLEDEERITAVAKMLGGEKPSAVSIENAREMVYN